MHNKTLDQYNAVGKVAFSGVPWTLLKQPEAPQGAIPTWAAIQRKNFFGCLKWVGFKILQAELGLQEPELRNALKWLVANGFVQVDKDLNQVTVIIGKDAPKAGPISELDDL